MLQDDITTIAVDVIVSAANPSLLGGSGIDGAIHRVVGPTLSEACERVTQQQGEYPTGHAVIALAGVPPAKVVIHTAGPVWQGGGHHEAEQLKETYLDTLQLALASGYQFVAFPAISTGAYGCPRATATEIAVKMALKFITQRMLPDQIYFVCLDEGNARLYKRLLAQQGDERTD